MQNFRIFDIQHTSYCTVSYIINKRKLFYLLLAICTLINCNQSERPVNGIKEAESLEIIVIDSTYLPVDDTIRLTQIADSLIYVLIKEPELSGRKEIYKIMTSKNYLFVHADHRLFQYSWEGQFLKEYENRKEFVYGFDILEDNNLLLVAFPNKIMIHALEGDYIKSIPLKKELQCIGSFFAAVDSNNIAVALWNEGTNVSRMVIMDFNGNIIKEYPNPETFNSENTPSRNASRIHRIVFRENSNVYYQPLFNDTIFKLVDFDLVPVLIEKLTLKVPLNERLEYTGDLNAYLQYCIQKKAYMTRSMASKRFYFIEAKNPSSMSSRVYMLYDKKNRHFNYYDLTLDFSQPVIQHGIYNDWDGGIALDAEFIDNGYMIGYYGLNRFRVFNNDELNLENCANDSICTFISYRTRSHDISRQSRNQLLTDFINELEEKEGVFVLMFAKLKE